MSAARADVCGALSRQMRSAGGGDPQVAQLRRQLAAIQGIERQRKCSADSARGGFFNACGDLARSRQAVQRRMAALSGSGNGALALQARYSELGCAPAGRQRSDSRPTAARATLGAKTMLFCVRLSDGYFFPAPNSQFAEKDDVKTTLDQCRFICDDAGVDLFALNDISDETEEMLSVSDRKPYKELSTAFRYRDDASFKACDLKRYTERVAELRARTVTPSDMSNAIIPLPTAKPVPTVATAAPAAGQAIGDDKKPNAAQQASLESAPRPVRVVGPAFFPE